MYCAVIMAADMAHFLHHYEVMITDKNGLKHIYEVTETEVVNPYDNSIKTQGDEKELTLFTCSQKGTMRFVVRCIYKEAVMDE